jgi:hypothetical protein
VDTKTIGIFRGQATAVQDKRQFKFRCDHQSLFGQEMGILNPGLKFSFVFSSLGLIMLSKSGNGIIVCFNLSLSGGVSNGASSHNFRLRCVIRFHRNSATRFDMDQLNVDLNLSTLINNMAINAVQIWILIAFKLVPIKVFIFKFCYSALKKISISHRSL